MKIGDNIVVWFKDDPREISGEVIRLGGNILQVKCIGEGGSSTTWNIWAKDVLVIGTNRAA